ncbi:MAG: response regulator transcription factor [Parasporobacterium sp.]|nr:response regulator transcription factor [Parasporobacterium sp.]
MNPVNIAIVEDDPADLARLSECINKYMAGCSCPCTIRHFESGDSFLKSPESFHLIFMDIEMPGSDGIETARQLRNRQDNAVLVLVTNMVKYAIHGYSVNAVDYIVKPVMYEQLAIKMPDFLERSRRNQKFLVIRQKQDVSKINIRQIRYIEIFRHDVFIQLDNTRVECYGTLKEFEQELEGCGFVKCSQSCLVNLNYIQSISGDEIIVDGMKLAVSRREKKNLMDAFIRFEHE